MTHAARLIIVLEGGFIQSMVSDCPMDVIVKDFDIDGAGEDELVKDQYGNECYMHSESPANDPEVVENEFNIWMEVEK